jgi:hypothetical protein
MEMRKDALPQKQLEEVSSLVLTLPLGDQLPDDRHEVARNIHNCIARFVFGHIAGLLAVKCKLFLTLSSFQPSGNLFWLIAVSFSCVFDRQPAACPSAYER